MSNDKSLLEKIIELIDSGKLELPVFNESAAKLQALNADGDIRTSEVEALVSGDQVLVAEILRAANSPFFGGLTEIHTVHNALVRLGLKEVSRLAIAASHKSNYDAKEPELRRMIRELWKHASSTAAAGAWLARKLSFGHQLEEEAFLGGPLHDVGKLVILKAIDEIGQTENMHPLSPEVLDEVMLSAHGELGYNFLSRWNIPDLYCEIARDHHLKDFESSRVSLSIVRLANQAGAKVGLSMQPDPTIVLGALPEAQYLNAKDIVLAELEIMMEDTIGSAVEA